MLNSQLKTLLTFLIRLDNSMHKPLCYCETLDIVLSMSNVCCFGHITQTCTAVPYGSTPHLVVSRNLKLVIRCTETSFINCQAI